MTASKQDKALDGLRAAWQEAAHDALMYRHHLGAEKARSGRMQLALTRIVQKLGAAQFKRPGGLREEVYDKARGALIPRKPEPDATSSFAEARASLEPRECLGLAGEQEFWPWRGTQKECHETERPMADWCGNCIAWQLVREIEERREAAQPRGRRNG